MCWVHIYKICMNLLSTYLKDLEEALAKYNQMLVKYPNYSVGIDGFWFDYLEPTQSWVQFWEQVELELKGFIKVLKPWLN
jgi:hypothetical protein